MNAPAKAMLAVMGIAVACHGAPRRPSPSSRSDAPSREGGAGSFDPSDDGTPPDPAPSSGGASLEPSSAQAGAAGMGESGAPSLGPFDGAARCTSGLVRDPNESEAPEMNPGFPCITCHLATSEGDAPVFAFAGTIYPSAHEPNSCRGAGASGAEIVITDAAGATLRAVANTSGNFLLEDARLVPPFSAKVQFEGRERATSAPHSGPDCNTCHTQSGDQGAPGRIVLP